MTTKLVIVFFLVGSLEAFFPINRKQKRFRKEWLTDIAHLFFNHFFVKVGSYIAIVFFDILLHQFISSPLQVEIANQPYWLQFLEACFIAELSFYCIHRLAHTLPWFWKIHVIHHSSEELDSLASVRFHPLEIIIANISVGMPLFLLGFTKEIFAQYLIFGAILTVLSHANISLRIPVLRWIIATPEFHHWHHSNEKFAFNKNFSGLPIIDFLFGTFYLPEKKKTSSYGVDELVPKTYWGQFLYPIK